MDQATLLGNVHAVPKPGDVSLCIRCGALAVFDETRRLRRPTGEEAIQFSMDHRVIQGQILIRGRNKQRKP
jgi:hypothetical protein